MRFIRSTRKSLARPEFAFTCTYHVSKRRRPGQNHDCWCLDHKDCESRVVELFGELTHMAPALGSDKNSDEENTP